MELRQTSRLAALVALPLVLALMSCSRSDAPNAGSADEHFFNTFKTAVASAGKDGYTPYWLGREFSAGGLTFQGPHVDDLPGARLHRGGVAMSYGAETTRGGGGVLDLSLYSSAAWAEARDRQDAPATKYVQVAGQNAKLSVLSAGTRPINELRLLLTFGDTTVLAIAGSVGAATPGGPDKNPLIDEATFLGVLQNLRPYPQ